MTTTLTVRELREQLADLDPDLPVRIFASTYTGNAVAVVYDDGVYAYHDDDEIDGEDEPTAWLAVRNNHQHVPASDAAIAELKPLVDQPRPRRRRAQ